MRIVFQWITSCPVKDKSPVEQNTYNVGTILNLIEANTRNQRQAREHACDQVTIGFSLAFDWLRKWREFFEPIREHSKAKSKQTHITFDTRLNTVLGRNLNNFILEKLT